MSEYNLAPICLFVYNRPEHLAVVLRSLRANPLADHSHLIVYSDGPRTDFDLAPIAEVRQLVKSEKWCEKIELVEAEKNLGLADSIINGITEVVNKYGKVIVLEDDLQLSPGFLEYMNRALQEYEDTPEVFHVSGYMFPIKERLPETFFLNIASCWGWATWRRAWNHFERDPYKSLIEIEAKGLKTRFNLGNSYDWHKDLADNYKGVLKSWAVRWYASFFLRNGYCLHPRKSLVRNIGMDGSGVNCGENMIFQDQALAASITVERIPVVESFSARVYVRRFFLKQNRLRRLRGIYSRIGLSSILKLCRRLIG